MVNPDEPPIVRGKSVTKKQIKKKVWQKCKTWTGFEPGTPGRKAITITTELKRILCNILGIVFKSRSSHA